MKLTLVEKIAVLLSMLMVVQCQSAQLGRVETEGVIPPLPEATAKEDVILAPQRSKDLLFRLYHTLSRTDQVSLRHRDMRLIEDLAALPEKTPLIEAIQVLAGVQVVLKNSQATSAFAKQDTGQVDTRNELQGSPEDGKFTQWYGTSSLEEYMGLFAINLPAVMDSNRFLKSYEIQILVQSALRQGSGQTEEFIRETSKVLRANVENWHLVAQRIGFGVLPGSVSATEQPASGPVQEADEEAHLLQDQHGIAAALPYNPASFGKDEAKLRQADALATESRYKESIALLKILSQSDFYRSTAQQKIVEASDAAVKKLRHQAAIAFKKARPVTDSQTRKAYLEDAKRLLVEALEDFPESSQIETVKNNLSVIERNLMALEN
ncbi:MAG: hypothetical protein OXT67_12375 [Zetaproteobacteria bacterium]|nr:hypothetical protein [Zetaproteobacteria bacterium]